MPVWGTDLSGGASPSLSGDRVAHKVGIPPWLEEKIPGGIRAPCPLAYLSHIIRSAQPNLAQPTTPPNNVGTAHSSLPSQPQHCWTH